MVELKGASILFTLILRVDGFDVDGKAIHAGDLDRLAFAHRG